MKKLITVCTAFFIAACLFAQAPEKMSCQAVIRDASNNLVTNQSVGMQISILQGSASGTVVYTETQTPSTNTNGLVSIEIGSGTVVSGNFTTINWANNGPFFIKTETDPTGGTNYTIAATSQLLSVPYALHAKTADTVTGTIAETDPVFGTSVANGITATDTSNWNKKQDRLTAGTGISISGDTINATRDSSQEFYLGQDTLGGIVCYIYLDQNKDQHGLIVSKTETTAQWQSTTSANGANRSWDGSYNTGLMSSSPVKNWITSNFSSDWYLPSVDELSLLWHNRFHVNKALNNGGSTLLSIANSYWSSTEINASYAFYFNFANGSANSNQSKTSTYNVRAVRAF